MNAYLSKLTMDWPFRVTRIPFFYGWVIWAISTLGVLMSVPGQTMGMAVFTDIFIENFQLSRTQISTAYLIGTVGSALLLTPAGRLYDRIGARAMVVGSSIGLAFVLVYISSVDRIGSGIAGLLGLSLGMVSFPLIVIGYFGVRFLGQGVLTIASRNVLLVWFDRRLGFVSSLSGMFVSLGFAIAPLILAAMIVALGWRGALWALAGMVGLAFASLALLLIRNRPEDVGLQPEGRMDVPFADTKVGQEATQSDEGPVFTLSQARRTTIFWLFSLALSVHALYGTAVVFHIVSIFGEMGRGAEEAIGYFLPSALVALSASMAGGWAADRISLKPLLILMLGGFLIGTVGLLNLDTALGYGLLVFGFGVGGGLWVVMSNLAFIRTFGAGNLGAISGFNQSITVFASAIGPIFFSLGFDLFGGYTAPQIACGAGILILLAWTVLMPWPDKRVR